MMMDDFYIKRDAPFPFFDVSLLDACDEKLMEISEKMELGLNLDEMKRAQAYFRNEGRNPSDLEMQALGQAWSEHACYKSSKAVLVKYFGGIDNEDVLSRGDAGVMRFDESHGYALRIESHNHPSAVEPYGGAATGIGGIVRDVLCMGAQPIGLIDPIYFGPLDTKPEELQKGIKHPRYLFSGVVGGIRDYGNRLGIPTISGGVYFDHSYTGNCLVNVGCVGIAKEKNIQKNAVKEPGDLFVLVGGRTGRDGIHGVTFASTVLTEKSETESRGAVQLGDPITEEPVIHACLEVADLGLLQGMKDLGGGGLSCVIGEMALAGGYGAEVELDKVPLKEDDMLPWEMWISESQERMMLAIHPDNLDKVMEVFDLYDVEANVVGRVIPEKIVKINFKGVKVAEIDLEFFTECPAYDRPARRPETKIEEKRPAVSDYTEALMKMLADQNVSSRDWVIRQYDHEVRAATVIKPLQGKTGKWSHGDASVLKPLPNSYRGLAVSTATSPWTTAIDPYRGGKLAMDEAYRALIAVGARPKAISDCLNFGNPEVPERMWEFREAVRGLGEACAYLGIPVPSGNVSFYNESHDGSILPTITVLGTGIIDDIRKAVTTDMKGNGKLIFMVGNTGEEMGGSLYYRLYGGSSAKVPDVNLERLKNTGEGMLKAMNEGLIESAHDISDGGLAVAITEMCLGGDIGAEIDLSSMKEAGLLDDVLLFSESPTRWLIEVAPENRERLLAILPDAAEIGRTAGEKIIVRNGERLLIDTDVNGTREAWQNTLWELMG